MQKTERKFKLDIKWIIMLSIVALLLIFEVFPLLYLFVKSVFPNGSFTFEAFKRVYSYDANFIAIRNTLVTAVATTFFGMLIAFPLAFLVGRTNLYGKKIFRTMFVITYMVPPYVGAMAWLRLLNPRVGTLNMFIQKIFGLSEPIFNIYSVWGMIWVLTCFYYPYAFITISRAMEKMDPSLEEAARISGASPLKTLFTVTIPMMTPSLIAAGLLVFVTAASCYGIPTRIIEFVHIGNEEGIIDATTLAVFLMIIANLVLYFSTFVLGKKQYITMSGKSTRPTIVDLGKWRTPLTILVSIFAFIVVIVPFITVALTSVTINMGKPLNAKNFSFRFWQQMLTRDSILSSTINSLIAASAAALIGIVISCMMAYLLQRTKVKGRKLPDFLITVGSGTPSIAIALALIMTMSGKFGINIYNTIYIMIIAYMIKYMLMGMRTVVSGMSQVHPSLEEASQISGASWLRMIKDVTAPLIMPSIVAGIFLIFMPSFYELTMSTLLYSSHTKTIGFELYNYQTYHSQQIASVLATAILIFVLLVNWILNKITKGKFSI